MCESILYRKLIFAEGLESDLSIVTKVYKAKYNTENFFVYKSLIFLKTFVHKLNCFAFSCVSYNLISMFVQDTAALKKD